MTIFESKEIEILELLGKGHTKKRIAELNRISYTKCLKKVKLICQKLHAINTSNAIYNALKNNIIK